MPVSTSAPPTLYLPALACEMGAWRYYVTAMRLADVAERIRFAEDLGKPARYDDWIQRVVNETRKGQISNYLLNQEDRFFSSLVVTVYGGAPRWFDLGLLDAPDLGLDDIPPMALDSIDRSLGLLSLSGDEELFPVDGQHRLAGIKAAVSANPDRGNEMVSVLFVMYRGKVETRRLFATLNRYAVPVNEGERIILDEDDGLAIITRRLMQSHPLFAGIKRLASPKNSSLGETDYTSFTTPITLYKINKMLCIKHDRGAEWSLKALAGSFRPPDEHLDRVWSISQRFWDQMADHFPAVGALAEKGGGNAVRTHRRTDGGHMLYRPAGQQAFARAIRALHNRGVSMEDAFAALKKIPMELAGAPWLGLLWQPYPEGNRGRMIPNVATQIVVSGLLLHWAGLSTQQDQVALLDRYRKVTGRPDAQLPQPTRRYNKRVSR